MAVIQIPVTHNNTTQIVETTAPSHTVVKIFHMTQSTNDLVLELKAQGHATQIVEHGLKLNYDEI